jgi:RNA recognition motif-containing protein
VPTLLFINNIPVTTTSQELQTLCSRYGLVKSSQVMRDGLNRSRGFAYVQMMTETAAEQARTELNGRQILSHRIDVNFAVNLILPTDD